MLCTRYIICMEIHSVMWKQYNSYMFVGKFLPGDRYLLIYVIERLQLLIKMII